MFARGGNALLAAYEASRLALLMNLH